MQNYKIIRDKINNGFEEIILKYIDDIKIQEMLQYVLNGGKRLRPVIFYSIMENKGIENCLEICLALELFHCCSLILDDLPCMDNDTIRRGKPAFHIKYGEQSSIIFVGYGLNFAMKLIRNSVGENMEHMRLILDEVYKNMGMLGACAGQYLDLCPILPGINKKEFIEKYSSENGLKEILDLKTTTFFKLVFSFGYILGEYNFDKNVLHNISYNFGMAFQIFDDFDDIEQDQIRKMNGEFTPNLILSIGIDRAYLEFKKHIELFEIDVDKYYGKNIVFNEIIEYLSNSVNTKYNKR